MTSPCMLDLKLVEVAGDDNVGEDGLGFFQYLAAVVTAGDVGEDEADAARVPRQGSSRAVQPASERWTASAFRPGHV